MGVIAYDLLTTPSNAYPDFRYDLFVDLFGRHFRPFVDEDGVPRIGPDISLSTFLFSATTAIIGAPAPSGLIAELQAVVGMAYAPGDSTPLQNQLNAVMVSWGQRTEQPDFPQLFEFVNDAQVMTVLADAVAGIERSLNVWRDVPFQLSEERAVLVSLAFEGYNLSTIMDALVLDGNRPDPWLDIRYISASNTSPTTEEAAQRYYRSAVFELYNDPANVSFEEAADVGRAYSSRRDTILAYEARFDPETMGMGAPVEGGRDGIATFLQPAITAVAQFYSAEVAHADELIFLDGETTVFDGDDPADGFNSAKNDEDLIVGSTAADTVSGGEAGDVLLGRAGDDSLTGDAGNDNLYGGEGADTLIGGNGSDKLWGGGDSDLLRGGKGNDSYVLGGDEELDPDSGGNPGAVGAVNTDRIVEAKRGGGIDTVIAQINSGSLNLRNVEKFKLDADVSGNLTVNLNEFDAFALSGGSDELTLVINRLQKTPIDIKTGGGADVVHIEFEQGVDPSQVLNGKGLTARFQFTDLTDDDTIDLTSIGIRDIFTERSRIDDDEGFYLLAPGVKLDIMDGKRIEKTYNNYTDNWFVVKCGDDTPYGPEFIGNVGKDNFEI